MKTEKDIYRKRKNFADIEIVIKNGNYFLDYNVKWYYKISWLLDLLITNLFYVLLAITLGWVVDDYLVKSLNKSDNKAFILAQACGQFIYLFIVFYVIIYVLGKYLPHFAIKPPPEHKYIKIWVSAFLSIAALFTVEPKLVAKIKYVFYNT